MDRSAMRTQVRDIIGEDTADFWSDAELNRYLTEAQFRFLGEANWPWALTAATGQILAGETDLDLTEGIAFSRQINFKLSNDETARPYQPTRVSAVKGFELSLGYTSGTTGVAPLYFYIVTVADDDDDNKFTWVARFIPAPAADMDVDYQYFREGTDLDADDAVPLLPVQYHKALVHHAAGTAWLKELNGGPKAQEQFELYNAVVNQAKMESFSDPDDDHMVMGHDDPQYDSVYGRPDYWQTRIPETLGP